jgi:hypothetical protein
MADDLRSVLDHPRQPTLRDRWRSRSGGFAGIARAPIAARLLRRRPISRALTPSWRSRNRCRNCRMLSSRFAGIPISSSTIDGPGVPQLLNRGEQTLRVVTGSGGRLHFGMVAGIKSKRRPTSNRNPRPDCVGIRK